MTRVRILPYTQLSKSAKIIANELNGKVLRLMGSNFRQRPGDFVINWGNTKEQRHQITHNPVEKVRVASNKLLFFNAIKEVNPQIIPSFYTDEKDIPDEKFPVLCRTVLAGHSGTGIVFASNRDELVPCQLYVQYVKKQDEYRIHLGKGRDAQSIIICVQRKARRLDVENPNWQIRNHNNGFVFARNNVVVPEPCIEAARLCFETIGLDFGAVDVIYNNKAGKAYVLEINTAPGLEGQTVIDYANFFRSILT